MCLYPRLIKNRKYTANKKNGGIIPMITDPRALYVPVGCNECMECRKQKARGWQVRLLEDIKENTNGKFITLTFSNESIAEINEGLEDLKGYEKDNAIATKATRLFLERWRKTYKKSLRHWLVTELGHNGTENIHMHGIVWTNEPIDEVVRHWKYGFVWKGKPRRNGTYENYVSERTINYIIKYVTKQDEDHREYKSKILTSPGIGRNYSNSDEARKNKYNSKGTKETYKTRTGHKIAMPIYWRNKIYTEKERETLWLERLDRGERWVCGDKLKANDSKTYFKLLDWHRNRNRQLGYGDNKRDDEWWDRKEYEKNRREILIQKRIQSAYPAGAPTGGGLIKGYWIAGQRARRVG